MLRINKAFPLIPAISIAAGMLSLLSTSLAIPKATDGNEAPTTHLVIIENMKYEPAALTIKQGDTVEFQNKDILPHTITAHKKNGFDSGSISGGAHWQVKPKKAGDYPYYCTFHPSMIGSITVK